MRPTRGALWILLATAWSTALANPEAQCSLRQLFTAQRAHFQEKDRFGSFEEVGFSPLPCVDGSRASRSSTSSCHFTYEIKRAGETSADFEAIARGAAGTFVLSGSGTVTREGEPLAPIDCLAWQRANDPLWNYHQVVAELDCQAPSPDPDHRCNVALRELIALAHRGVGVARLEYEAHPTARELDPAASLSSAERLCAVTDARAGDRAGVARQLADSGELAEAIRRPHCADAGVRAGSAVLIERLPTICPGPRCIEVLARARQKGLGEQVTAAAALHPEAVAVALEADGTNAQRFAEVLGHPRRASGTLSRLLRGEAVPAGEVLEIPRDPVTDLLRARASAPVRARWNAAAQLHGREAAGAETHRWVEAADCGELMRTASQATSGAVREAFLPAAGRCPGLAGRFLELHSSIMTAEEILSWLERVPRPRGSGARAKLDMRDERRALAILPTIIHRYPDLLNGMSLTGSMVAVLLDEANSAALGGRRSVVASLLGRGSPPRNFTLREGAWEVLWPHALAQADSAADIRDLAARALPDTNRQELGRRARGNPQWLAAAAAGHADSALGSVAAPAIPEEQARACVAELKTGFGCLDRVAARLGPVPPGRPTFIFGVPTSTEPQPPIDAYCQRFSAEAERRCHPVCGGGIPSPREVEALLRSAQVTMEVPAALRACTPSLGD